MASKPKYEDRGDAIFAVGNVAYVILGMRPAAPVIEDFNPGAEKMFGYARDEAIGRPAAQLHPPEDRLRMAEFYGSKEGFSSEVVFVRRYGGRFTGWLTSYPLPGPRVRPHAVLAAIIDVSARKAAEQALQESELRYRTLIDSSLAGIIIIRDLRFAFVNRKLASLLGYERADEIVGRPITDLVHPADREMIRHRAVRRLRGEPEAEQYEFRGLTKDGGTIWLEARSTRAVLDGEPVIIGNIVDISERRRVDDQLRAHFFFLQCLEHVDRVIRKADDLQQMMMDVLDAVLAIFESDRAWLLYPCDPGASEWHVPMERTRPGFPGAAAQEARFAMGQEARGIFTEALNTGEPIALDPASGKPLPEVVKGRFNVRSQLALAVHPKIGSPWLFGMHQCTHARIWKPEEQLLFREIGRRIADALSSLLFLRDLRQSEEKYREVVEGTDDLIARLDREGRFLYVNRAGTRIVGRSAEEITSMRLFDAVHPDDRTPARRALQSWIENRAAGGSLENRIVGPEGEVRYIFWSVNLHYDRNGDLVDISTIGRDVTQRKQTELELRSLERKMAESQKMEALGTLAGGIAHDFNNILSIIFGFAELSRANASDPQRILEYTAQILRAGARARDLVKQILAFSRRGSRMKHPVSIFDVVQETLKLLSGSMPRNVEVRTAAEAGCGTILADEVQMQQVIMNLCTNAMHAMRGSGGVLEVTVAPMVVSCNNLPECPPELAPGQYIRLTVSDTGSGMDRRTMGRAFEPFFTTKEVGEGSGMGLSVAHGIVKEHGGAVFLESDPGKGTRVTVCLPAHGLLLLDREEATPAQADVKGPGRILVVDDEPVLMNLEKAILTSLGYQVRGTTDSRLALEFIRDSSQAYDLLITDRSMPGVSGECLIAELKKIRPTVPAIMCTGTNGPTEKYPPAGSGASEILIKPFTREDLALAVLRALLSRSPAPKLPRRNFSNH